ncbi:hypothetical protein D3C87_1683200 [compost metagenome]
MLGFWQVLDLLFQSAFLLIQLTHLGHQCLVGRMFAGEAVFHFSLLELQLGNQGFQGYDLIEYSFGFDSNVHRASAALVGIQLAFGFLKLFAHVRQLGAQKLQALRGFG